MKTNMKKLFSKLIGKRNSYEVFFDFVKMSAISISNSVDKYQAEEREKEYLSIAKKYSSGELKLFCDIFATLVLELERKMGDVLGEIYMELDISSKSSGQFFTPYYISKLMAELTYVEKEEITTLCDPCVGGGSMIIAYAEIMYQKGINYQEKLRVHCSDIDRNVLLMCYLQLSLLGITAVCERKNILDNEKGELWFNHHR